MTKSQLLKEFDEKVKKKRLTISSGHHNKPYDPKDCKPYQGCSKCSKHQLPEPSPQPPEKGWEERGHRADWWSPDAITFSIPQVKRIESEVQESERARLRKEIDLLIAKEINIAHSEDQPTSRLTSLAMEVKSLLTP